MGEVIDVESLRLAYHEARDAYEADLENQEKREEYLERKQWFGDARSEWRLQEIEAGRRGAGMNIIAEGGE